MKGLGIDLPRWLVRRLHRAVARAGKIAFGKGFGDRHGVVARGKPGTIAAHGDVQQRNRPVIFGRPPRAHFPTTGSRRRS